MEPERIVIVGGVAGGASCAARARRLSEKAEILVIERGPYVSFANCGLPYHVGEVIQKEEDLLVATPELFKKRFNVEVCVNQEVVSIDREAREVLIRDLQNGEERRERYGALVLSPGARPIRPPLPGIDLPGIFALRTIPDTREIRRWIADRAASRAVIVGGGFIGLEMAESLAERGISVTIMEMLPQVMPPLDPEMAAFVHQHLKSKGVNLRLGCAVTGFEGGPDGSLRVLAASGAPLDADLVILSIGVRPDVELAGAAGLEVGELGGIRVDEQMRTSDPSVWAVGDAVEVRDLITKQWCLVPLAGPANRQGRIAADAIFGRSATFRGVQATAVCGLFGMTVAMTGANEKRLRTAGLPYEKVYLHPAHHVGYYPGARQMTLKLLFSVPEGRILGLQAVGEAGVEKRVDVAAMAIQKEGTVFDLEEAELCYAPQFGAAKDPINFAGMIAANLLRGDAPTTHWTDIDPSGDTLLVDVRDKEEWENGHVPGAEHVPLTELRERMEELPRDREVLFYCGIGQRSYYATRVLQLNGRNTRNVSGGFRMYMAQKETE